MRGRKKNRASTKEHVDPVDVGKELNAPGYISTETINTVVREENAKPKQVPYYRKDQPSKRRTEARKAREIKDVLDKSTMSGRQKLKQDVGNLYATSRNLFEMYKPKVTLKAQELWSNKWFRRGAKGVGGVLAFNLLAGGIRRLVTPNRPIPEQYDRGYDVLKEYMTDFGSPLHLAKAAQKSLRQYHSTTRRALNTTVESVISKNYALASSRNAIGHTRY